MTATEVRDPVRSALESVLDEVRSKTSGEVASYIPELARVDPDPLGVALVSVHGVVHEAGDTDTHFTIQSVSKPFVFALAVDALGLEQVLTHVGIEPSGEPFNAISLEPATGRPLNPMINAGAIVMSSLMAGDTADEKFAAIHAGIERFAGRDLVVDEAVFSSEAQTGNRNRALAYLTLAAGTLGSPVDVATTAYFRQCSISVTARDLATMAATLATGGVNPITRERVISEDAARWTSSVMTSCGMYDESGDWLMRVGLPAKSGVGGGIAAELPGQFGIGTFSPRLDAKGNSVRGVAMLEAMSARFELHQMQHRGEPLSPVGSLTRNGAETVAALRGELFFSGAEEVFARLSPLLSDDGCLVLDFSDVTRVGDAAARLFREAPGVAGQRTDGGGDKVVVRDPEGVLGH
ncbi:glutaminase A [Agromyces salentinus]|uniref:Glutaminase n=1 Tax=Agromyces salentinus TaxID=269421 RepID=A0ABN2MLW4_9MICO|nr:glutaminase A [Agromyces salentinus]